MSEYAITVEGLSKRYRIRHQIRHDTLRDVIMDRAASLLSWKKGAGDRSTEDFWSLQDVNFNVAEGDVVGVIGRNGAGKSTLLKILSRITEPTKGKIRIKGRIASLLEVGTGFHPELSGRENIFLNGAILGMSRKDIVARFDEIVGFAEVERFLDTPVKQYSSGMYVRLAFAVAAHLEPDILIIDEVLAVGDSEFQKKCLGKMKEVASESGRTVLFVSHNLPMVQSICTKGLLLSAGRTEGVQGIGETVANYLKALNENRENGSLPHPQRPVVLNDVRLVSVSGSESIELQPNKIAKLRVAMSSCSEFSEVRVTIAFTDAQGQRVFALASFHSGKMVDLKKGMNAFVVDFTPPALFPGTFSVDIGVYSRSGDTLAEVYGAAYFEFGFGGNEVRSIESKYGYGLVRVPSVWQESLCNN